MLLKILINDCRKRLSPNSGRHSPGHKIVAIVVFVSPSARSALFFEVDYLLQGGGFPGPPPYLGSQTVCGLLTLSMMLSKKVCTVREATELFLHGLSQNYDNG